MVIIVMGVSGCGKTTIGEKLSNEIGVPFFDADNFHPQANIDKMKNSIALTDVDRKPWLDTLAVKIKDWEQSGGAVLACSALKESYREQLFSNEKNIFLVFLYGTFELITKRMKERDNHYMKVGLLQSQFDTLEVPEYGLHINIEKPVGDIIAQIKNELNT